MKKTFTDEELEGLYKVFKEYEAQNEGVFAAYVIKIGVSYLNWERICGYFLEKGVDLKELLKNGAAKSEERNVEGENA